MNDTTKPKLSFNRERDFEDFLIDNEDFFRSEFCLNPKYTVINRQMNLGVYGIADIVAITNIEGKVQVEIFELKNEPFSHSNISQLARYKKFFDDLITVYFEKESNVICNLIGPKTFPNNSDLCFLCQDIPWLTVYEFELDPINGIEFNHISGWSKTGNNESKEEEIASFIDLLGADIPFVALKVVKSGEEE